MSLSRVVTVLGAVALFAAGGAVRVGTAHATGPGATRPSVVATEGGGPDQFPAAALSVVSTSTDGDLGNQDSIDPQVSADGTVVACRSQSSNLDPASPAPAGFDEGGVFVRNTVTGVTERVDNQPTDGVLGAWFTLSADGHWIAWN